MSKKDKKKKGVNMDDILDQLNELKKEVHAESADSNDVDDRIRKILKDELKNIGIKQRVAANEMNDNIDEKKVDRKPKTIDEKIDDLIKLVESLILMQNRNQQPRISNRRMPWDEEYGRRNNGYGMAYDEYGKPLEVEVLDNNNDCSRDKVRRFFDEIGYTDDSSSRFINDIFGYKS